MRRVTCAKKWCFRFFALAMAAVGLFLLLLQATWAQNAVQNPSIRNFQRDAQSVQTYAPQSQIFQSGPLDHRYLSSSKSAAVMSPEEAKRFRERTLDFYEQALRNPSPSPTNVFPQRQ